MRNKSKKIQSAPFGRGLRSLAVITSLLASNLFPNAAQAQETKGEWEFQLAPLFLWGMSINGESAIDGNVAEMDLDFKDDLFENLDTAMTLHFEARKQDLVLFLEYQYVSVDPSVNSSIGPVSINADVDFTVNIGEMGGGYTLSQSDVTRWEVLGGVRWQDHDLDVGVDGPEFLPDQIKGGDDWYQGFLGGRVTRSFGNAWSLIARGDYGYGGSDNDALHLSVMADYRFKKWGSAFAGLRYLKADYEGSGYSYNATQQGPQVGVVFYW